MSILILLSLMFIAAGSSKFFSHSVWFWIKNRALHISLLVPTFFTTNRMWYPIILASFETSSFTTSSNASLPMSPAIFFWFAFSNSGDELFPSFSFRTSVIILPGEPPVLNYHIDRTSLMICRWYSSSTYGNIRETFSLATRSPSLIHIYFPSISTILNPCTCFPLISL